MRMGKRLKACAWQGMVQRGGDSGMDHSYSQEMGRKENDQWSMCRCGGGGQSEINKLLDFC